jgi:hypothetical protein
MINVKVNKGDPTDLYEQVAAEIRRAIAEHQRRTLDRPLRNLPALATPWKSRHE